MNRILLVAVLLFSSVIAIADGKSSRLADTFDNTVYTDVDGAHFESLLDETDQSANYYSFPLNISVACTSSPEVLTPAFYTRSLNSNAIRAPPIA